MESKHVYGRGSSWGGRDNDIVVSERHGMTMIIFYVRQCTFITGMDELAAFLCYQKFGVNCTSCNSVSWRQQLLATLALIVVHSICIV